MSRIPKVLLVLLAGLLILLPLLHGRAFASHEQMVPPAKEISILSIWLKISGAANRDLTGFPVDQAKVSRELDRLTERLRPMVAAAGSGEEVVKAFRSVLLKEEGFRYDSSVWKVENYLIGGVLSRKEGNCLGLSLLWLTLAERLNVPFHGVYVPGHCFVRYDDGATRGINVEFSDNGASWEDERYLRIFTLPGRGPYLRSLSSREMLGVFFKSVGASYTAKGRHMEALAIYDEAGKMYPGLPDVHYNAGVSLQRMGRPEQAIDKYRQALTLDPHMIMARGNLASSYSACGNYDEGIREYQKAVEQDPSNVKAREGLTRALYAKGDYAEAAREAERAEALGCKFTPSILEALGPYRTRNREQAASR